MLSLFILTPWIIVRWPDSIRPAHAGLILMRGATVVVSLLCYYYAVSVIPLAEAVLLNFSAPIFVPILGFLVFRFALNRAVLVAVVIGFAGAALMLKPGTGTLRTRRPGWTRGGCARRTRCGSRVAHPERGGSS